MTADGLPWFDAHCDWLSKSKPLPSLNGCWGICMAVFSDLDAKDRAEQMLRQIARFEAIAHPRFLLGIEDISPIWRQQLPRPLYAGLCWNQDNILCGGCLGQGTGLTAQGRQAVQKLAADGIFVDLSHASRKTFFDVMEMNLPVCVSHAGCFDAFPHPRNLDRAQVDMLIERNCFWGLPLAPVLLGGSSFRSLFAHIRCALSWGAEKILGIGSDWCGCQKLITPFDTSADLPRLYSLLEARGIGGTCNILFKNAARLLAGKGQNAM